MIDRAVHSLWLKPAGDGHVGFNSEASLVNSTTLSLFLAKKLFKTVGLVTDTKGKELLIDKYNLPYDDVDTSLDTISNIDKRHWAIGKIVACSLQKEPFLHLDSDVFLFKKLPKECLDADAFFQNKENLDSYPYYNYLLNRAKNFYNSPLWDYDRKVAYNCGVIGLNNLSVTKKWLDDCLEYIKYYENDNVDSEHDISSLIFEQYRIVELLEIKKYDVKFLEEGYINDDRAKELGYSHMISSAKRLEKVEKAIIKRVIKEGLNPVIN